MPEPARSPSLFVGNSAVIESSSARAFRSVIHLPCNNLATVSNFFNFSKTSINEQPYPGLNITTGIPLISNNVINNFKSIYLYSIM